MNERPPSPSERALLDRLLSAEFLGSAALRMQAASAAIRALGSPLASALIVEVEDSAPRALVRGRVPVEGEAADLDGVKIHLLVHVVRGKLSHLEIYREDGKPILELPKSSVLEVFAV